MADDKKITNEDEHEDKDDKKVENAESAPEKTKIPYEIVTEESLPNSVKKYTLKADASLFKTKLEEKLQELKSNVTIPGFRKGKAPMKLIEIQFGEAGQREVVEDLFPQLISQVQEDKDVEIVGEPALKHFDVGEDGSVTIETEVEYIAPIELSDEDYKNIEVEIQPVKVTDETIEHYLEDLRWQNAVLESKPEDTSYEKGEALIADISVVDEAGHKIAQLSDENRLYRRPDTELPSALVSKLSGKKRGETVEAEIKRERKNEEGEVVSKKDIYTLTIRDFKSVKKPDLDDEFAKDLGDFESLDDFRKKTRESLEQRAREEERRHIISKVFSDIIDKYKLEIPRGLLAKRTQELALGDLRRWEDQGLSLPKGMEEQFFSGKAMEAAQSLYHWLISREIAKRENITVGEDDINKELERIAEQAGRKPLAIRASLERNKQFDEFVEQIKFKKVEDFIVDNVTIKPKEADKEGAD